MNLWMLALATVAFQDVPDSKTTPADKTIKVKVAGTAMPWDVGANPRMRLGLADGTRPARAIITGLLPGISITIKATGLVRSFRLVRAELRDGMNLPEASYGPEGGDTEIVNGFFTDPKDMFPSVWAGSSNAPSHYMELMGAFVDAEGKVVGKPFMIGRERKVVVPEGAVALSMGLNDVTFAENSGSFDVTVLVPRPSVTVE